MPTRSQRGQIRQPRNIGIRGEISAAPLIERGFVSVGPQGTTAQYVWRVKNIGGPVELRTALAIHATGIPQYGAWHSFLGVAVSNVRAELVKDSTTQADVTVDYGLSVEGGGGWFDNVPSEIVDAQWEVATTVQSTTTNMYQAGPRKGQQIVLFHIERDEEGEVSETREQYGEVAYQQAMSMVIGRRRENFSPGVAVPNGRLRSIMYVNHTNKTPYFGDPAGSWLCTRMGGASDDNGVTWNVTYEFQRREPQTARGLTEAGGTWEISLDGWDTLAVYRDPVTKEPIKVTDPNNELAKVTNYPYAEFHELRLYTP